GGDRPRRGPREADARSAAWGGDGGGLRGRGARRRRDRRLRGGGLDRRRERSVERRRLGGRRDGRRGARSPERRGGPPPAAERLARLSLAAHGPDPRRFRGGRRADLVPSAAPPHRRQRDRAA